MTNSSALDMARLRDEVTHQINTFDRHADKTHKVARGETITLAEAAGRGYIATLWLTFPGYFWRNWQPSAPINQSILKTLILRIFWDGATRPAVETPIGDFFGLGLCEVTNFTSRFFGMSSGGFYCRFPMPFNKGFRIEIENKDREIDTEIYANILYQLTDDLPVDRGYFHTLFQTGENSGRQPLLMVTIEGARGHYAGCTLSMQAEEMNYLSFLEPPEYIFVDDDWESARIVGTGLEDYFLGGWYFREGCFHGDLHGVTAKNALNSTVAMYRVHDSDAIHFGNRFRLQFLHPSKGDAKPFRHSSASFFYLDTAEGVGTEVPSAEELLCWYRVRNCDHQSIP